MKNLIRVLIFMLAFITTAQAVVGGGGGTMSVLSTTQSVRK